MIHTRCGGFLVTDTSYHRPTGISGRETHGVSFNYVVTWISSIARQIAFTRGDHLSSTTCLISQSATSPSTAPAIVFVRQITLFSGRQAPSRPIRAKLRGRGYAVNATTFTTRGRRARRHVLLSHSGTSFRLIRKFDRTRGRFQTRIPEL